MTNRFLKVETVPRENWYRISEREENKTRADFKEGTDIRWKRSIIRSGYWFQPKDMDTEAMNDIAIDLLAERIGILPGEVMDLVSSLTGEHHALYKISKRYALFDRKSYYWPLRKIYREVKENWLYEQKASYKGNHPLDLRTFWYFDHELCQGRIKYIVTRQIGKYWPGRTGIPYDVDAYDPPSLSVKVYQRLYECYSYTRMIGGKAGVLVHPLDAKEVGK